VTSARIVSDAFFFDFSHATCDGVKNTATRSVFFSFVAAIDTSRCVLCTHEYTRRAGIVRGKTMRSWSCLLLMSLAGFGTAQSTPNIPHAGETIEVSIVNVDAVVTDKRGARIHGLRKEDFEIYENGVRQPITNFAEYASERDAATASGAASNAAPGTAQPPPAQRRTIIVFIERFQLPSFRSDPLFTALKKLLHGAVRPGDRVMVVSWNNGILGVRQDFTDNIGAIDKAIDGLAERTTTVIHDQMADLEHDLDATNTFEAEVGDFQAQKGFAPAAEIPRESGMSFFIEEASRFSAKSALVDEQRKVNTINALMRSNGSAEGKKILLLATHRLSMYAGAEAMYAAGSVVLPSDFRLDFYAKPIITSMVETANANGFVIYPVYPEGLASNPAGTSELRSRQRDGKGGLPTATSVSYDGLVLTNETPMLEYVAKETGGMTAWGSSDVTKLLPAISDDFESYYSLAYSAPHATAAARRIEVKVKDPRLIVRARKQVLPKSDSTKMEDRVISTLFGNAPPSSFQVRVLLGLPKLNERKQYRVPVTIEVPVAALAMLPADGNSSTGAFTVYTAWGATLGGVSDTHHETKQFTIAAADVEKAKQQHFTYQFDVASATPYLRIALGVYDEVSKEYALSLVDLEPPPKK
jgi:VWFA-related protein